MPGCPSSRAPRRIRSSSRNFSGGTGSGAAADVRAAAGFDPALVGCESPELSPPDAAHVERAARRKIGKPGRLVGSRLHMDSLRGCLDADWLAASFAGNQARVDGALPMLGRPLGRWPYSSPGYIRDMMSMDRGSKEEET